MFFKTAKVSGMSDIVKRNQDFEVSSNSVRGYVLDPLRFFSEHFCVHEQVIKVNFTRPHFKNEGARVTKNLTP